MREKEHKPQAKSRAAFASERMVQLRLSLATKAKRQVVLAKPAEPAAKPARRTPAGQGPGCGSWWVF